jgi:glutamate-ammonia-ligase adenylyltransferase
MKTPHLSQAIATCADPPRADAAAERLRETAAGALLRKLGEEQARILAALLAGSQVSAELLATHPDWLGPLLEAATLNHPLAESELRGAVESWLRPMLKRNEYEPAWARLRECKQRELLRIAARDLGRLANALEITAEISLVADVILDAALRLCSQELGQKFGQPYHLDAAEHWEPSRFAVLGLGKLGGLELNYSSDVDVLFVYSEEGHVFKSPPHPREQSGKGMSNHQFFAKLAEKWVAEISRMTPEGSLFRIDLRLRPEGKAGPIVRSLASYEHYYAQWGQTWERMMLIKARPVAGDRALGEEFVEALQSYRYPRSLSERTVREVAAVKKRIEDEILRHGEMERNVKLGRGGIREIEFVAQTWQILRAGRSPFLQGGSTVPVLRKLAEYGLLKPADARELEDAYIFLRDIEHRLQMDAHQQTHTIPTERRARQRLALLMGFEHLADFETARRQQANTVRRIYDQLLGGDEPEPRSILPENDAADAEENWLKLLERHSVREPVRAREMVRDFLSGPGYAHISQRTVELARELLPRFFALCPRAGATPTASNTSFILSDPDRVLVRLDSFIDAYGARATLYELWIHNPSLFELLLLLFDRSEFLAEQAIRTPDLVDELELSGRLRRPKSGAETLQDLWHGLRDQDQGLWLRQYHQVEFMRIGLRDILGLVESEQNVEELTSLADACLQYALEVVTRRAGLKTAPFCVVGLGKLGGKELSYGSDLDILFVAPDKSRPAAELENLAVAFLELFTGSGEGVSLFRIDTKLRPDGEKGLLVNTVAGAEEYYRTRAGLWEIQALTRARIIGGDAETGAQFQQMAAALTNFTPEHIARGFPILEQRGGVGLAAYSARWKSEIDAMRYRIARERTPAGQDRLAIKTGRGGLIDAEFLAQALCLEHGWQEPNTLRALERATKERLLAEADAGRLVANYRALRRIESILRRWSYAGETVLPADEPAQQRVAVRCGFASARELLHAQEKMRLVLREAYDHYFKGSAARD